MGWIGPLWVGLAVGAAARWLHPRGMPLGLLAAML
ncbi:GlsB/YeaQ/YmgE family stress response membrane protein, partial [Ralstonia pseudosolanacearum]